MINLSGIVECSCAQFIQVPKNYNSVAFIEQAIELSDFITSK